jgi:DNA primase
VGELWGWQLKKHGWVRNYPEGIHKGDTLFGIERAHAETGMLLESPLDVVRFHSVYAGSDISAVASFGANVSDRQVALLSDRFNGLIIAFDNDGAGRTETKRLRSRLSSFRNGVKYWKYNTDDKDLGDMSDYTIIHGLQHLTSVYV